MRWLLIFILSISNLYGQDFVHSGYVYNINGGGMNNVPVKLFIQNKTQYAITNPTYSSQAFTGGTAVSGCDDCVQGPYNIGFSFTYFGNTYTQIYVSSNGWIGFSSGQTTGYTAAYIPNGSAPKNAILADWEDLFPTTGTMNYYTTGSSPNRKFVFNFNRSPHYSCRTTYFTFQFVLYEGSNVIDINYSSKPLCSGNAATAGLINSTGSVVVPLGGKNASTWSVSSQTYRFTPITGTSSYVYNKTVKTNTSGYYSISGLNLDINTYNFQLTVDSLVPKSTMNISDYAPTAKLINRGRTPTGADYYLYDVNNTGTFTVADLYWIFAVRSGRFSTWPSPTQKSILLTPTEKTTINSTTLNLKSSIPGTLAQTYSGVLHNATTNFYILGTGYANQAITY